MLYALANGSAVDLDKAFNLDYKTAHLFMVRKAMESRYYDALNNIVRSKQ